jgi:hypothetical protein
LILIFVKRFRFLEQSTKTFCWIHWSRLTFCTHTLSTSTQEKSWSRRTLRCMVKYALFHHIQKILDPYRNFFFSLTKLVLNFSFVFGSHSTEIGINAILMIQNVIHNNIWHIFVNKSSHMIKKNLTQVQPQILVCLCIY